MNSYIGNFQNNSNNFDDEEDEEKCPTIIKRSYSADWVDKNLEETDIDDDDDDDDEIDDSDSEFLVHPCLRSLIKSKSAYTVPKDLKTENFNKIKPSKTSFEISLTKMMESTTKSIAEENEYSVADLLPCLDKKWPDPDDEIKEEEERKRKKRKKSSGIVRYSPSNSNNSNIDQQNIAENDLSIQEIKRSFECWSSPPNFILNDEDPDENGIFSCFSPVHQRCWSAPDLTDDLIDEDDLKNSSRSNSIEPIRLPILTELIESQISYPIIETPDNDPSVCSYHLPSSSIGSLSSPSPPRPFSPVFGQPPAIAYRLHQSKSMNLPSRPDISEFLDNLNENLIVPQSTFSIGTSSDEDSDEEEEEEDDEWNIKKEEEVWPENGFIRSGWTDNEGRSFVHRSATFQFESNIEEEWTNPTILISKSAHSQLYNLGGDGSENEENEINVDQKNQLTNSEHSQLDDGERKELETRQAWMDRGSILCLGLNQSNSSHQKYHLHPELFDNCDMKLRSNGIQSQYGSYCSLNGSSNSNISSSMKRSFTTDEFRKTRRRLPRRPDDLTIPVELPQSRSMYERTICSQFGSQNGLEFNLKTKEMNCSTDNQHLEDYTICRTNEKTTTERPPTLSLQTTINTIIENNRNSMDPPNRRTIDHLETPISPHAVLVSPSGSSSGRRLPPLPINSIALLRRIPPNMSLPSNISKPQDHTLCFMDGIADSMMERSCVGIEESYFEEDGINGNRRKKHRKSFFSPDDSSGVSSCTTSDSQNPTHRVQSAFHPRHSDEVLLEIGDAVHVDRTSDDHWSYGTNLRTGQSGIFPSSVVCEIDLVEEICLGALPSNTAKIMNDDRDTFYLTMLASIEVAHHKGNDILIQAMNKVLTMYKNSEEIIVPQTVLMEISFRGIHVIDKRRKNFFQCPMFDFFYSLQNISFCGAHPKQLKYFGFITKHPLLPRFACHVFMSNSSTQPIVEAIGRAFKRSYDEYMAFAHPTEDIYLE